MNSKPLVSNEEISSFFYDNKLYEFAHKKLPEARRKKMKKMAEDNPEAKFGIGTVLMALEYLEKLNLVELEISDEDLEEAQKKKEKKRKLVNIIFFFTLTLCFIVSGYFLLLEFGLGR